VQLDAPAALMVPAGQTVHTLAPPLLNVPAGHREGQAEMAAELALKQPALTPVQLVAPMVL
jgi:hypothetical protein